MFYMIWLSSQDTDHSIKHVCLAWYFSSKIALWAYPITFVFFFRSEKVVYSGVWMWQVVVKYG
jgi:hypothetical protein